MSGWRLFVTGTKHKNEYPSDTVISFILGRHRGKSLKVFNIVCGFGNYLRSLLDNGFDAFVLSLVIMLYHKSMMHPSTPGVLHVAML